MKTWEYLGRHLKIRSLSAPLDFRLTLERLCQVPLPFFAKHPAHPLFGGEGGVVRDASGCRRVADGLPEDGNVPEHLPRPFADTLAYGVLHFLGLAEQDGALRRRAFVDFNTGVGVDHGRP